MTITSAAKILAGIALVGALGSPSIGVACSYIPAPWQRQVTLASFVGVVECETAGVGVARYRVVESWKGAPVGSVLTVEDRTGFWRFPSLQAHLCGERYVLCAFPLSPTLWNPNSRWWSETGIHAPLLWRDAGAALSVTSLVRTRPKSAWHNSQFGGLGFNSRDVSAYRDSVLALAAQPDSIGEASLLRRAALVEFSSRARDKDEAGRDTAPLESLRASIQPLGVTRLILTLWDYSKREDVRYQRLLESAISGGGGANSLRVMRQLEAVGAFGPDTAVAAPLLRMLESRFSPRPEDAWRSPVLRSSHAGHPLLDLQQSLTDSSSTAEGLALALLTPTDPDLVCEHLLRRSPAKRDLTAATAYSLASYFGWQCPRDRTKYFRQLLTAADPVIRVAGAVYLATEDSTEGMQALRSMTSLPGFAGRWASLTLARRGVRTAADSLMTWMESPASGSEAYWHRMLNQRLQFLTLLSNSARSSRVPDPPYVDPELINTGSKAYRKSIRRLQKWWADVKERIVLADPWLPAFASRGVD